MSSRLSKRRSGFMINYESTDSLLDMSFKNKTKRIINARRISGLPFIDMMNLETRNLTKEELKNRFIKSVRLAILCRRLCIDGKAAYDSKINRFISFAQIGVSELTKLDDEGALIKAEMMNFNNSFKAGSYLKCLSTQLFSYPIYLIKNVIIAISISEKTKQILQKIQPRTSTEVNHLQTAFKRLPYLQFIQELERKLLDKFCKVVWLEEFTGKRVIVAQYHLPRHFYIVLSGSLACTYRKPDEERGTTICFIEKGMCFGDMSIKSETMHTSSLISTNNVQLLVIQRDEFFNIFVGRKSEASVSNKTQKDINFIGSLPLFKQWPKELFEENPNALTTYCFQRNQIITKDSHASKHIYIVKSGFMSVWLKLNLAEKDCYLNEIKRRAQEDVGAGLSESDGSSLLPKNSVIEVHHNDVLFKENASLYVMNSGGDTDKARAIKMKMRYNETLDFLSGLKKKDRELSEDIGTTRKVTYEPKKIKWAPNGAIYKYENIPKIEAREANTVSLPGLTKNGESFSCGFIF